MSLAEKIRWACYMTMVLCFLIAGGIDLYQKHWKLVVIAVSFGVLNALIFFWR